MKLPARIPNSTVNFQELAPSLVGAIEMMGSTEQGLTWLRGNEEDIYIYAADEPGFADWTDEDYAANVRQNSGEPYAIRTPRYVVVHDYC